MIASRLRLILGIELIAYYFVAPYIILLGLDEKRGLLDAATEMNVRLWAYALLVGIYPFLLMLISPYRGQKLDQRQSKISALRKIHLANSSCYMLLAVASALGSLPLAILALAIPGVIGCASPVGKSLIASLTEPEVRVKEFAKLSLMKGIVKCCIPLVGALMFKVVVGEAYYWPLFIVSGTLSFGCFLYSFTFPKVCISCETGPKPQKNPTLSLLKTLVRNNYPLLIIFVMLICSYSVFIKYTPFMLFEKIGNNPYIVNYFASLVGLTYSINQFLIVRYSDYIARFLPTIFIALTIFTILLCLSNTGPLWFMGYFAILFCFAALSTCVEARLSLQGAKTTQGTVQGILYSVENWGYITAPLIGSFIASFSTSYPLYFVTVLSIVAALIFTFQNVRSPSERYT